MRWKFEVPTPRRGHMTHYTSTKRNAMESPLLRVPAELRLRIWKYAAGRNIFSVYTKSPEPWIAPITYPPAWWDLRGSICTFNFCANTWKYGDDSDIEYEFVNGSILDPRERWHPRIAPIFARGIATGVCRQIRAETLNLQYQTQIFDFDHLLFLDHYAYTLSAAQRSSVRIIQLCSVFFPSCESVPSYSTIIENFPNVKQIYHE